MYRPEFMMYSDESADDEELSPIEISDDVSSDSDGGKRRQRHREGEDSEDAGDYMMSDEYNDDDDEDDDENIMQLANGDQLVQDASAKYPITLLSSLNDLQDCKLFCDVRIKVGTETFDAHKAVLAAASGFFRTMFTSEFKEKNQDEVAVDGESDIFKRLLASIYTGKLIVNEAAETFNMALLMQLNHVFPLILSYLKDQQRHGHVPRIRNDFPALTMAFQVSMLASRGSYQNDCLNEIKEICHERIRREWKPFTNMEGFLQDVTVDFLEDILDQGKFPCEEYELLETVVCWLKHDWEKRQTHAVCLLRRIRLGLVKRDDLKKLIGDQIVEIPDCNYLLMEALRIHELTDKEAAERQTDFQRDTSTGGERAWFNRRIGLYQPFRERFPDMCASRTTMTVLISTGGKLNKKSGASYFMLGDKSKEQGWTDFKRFSKKLQFDNFRDHSTIVANGRIYIIGGTTIKQWPKVRRKCTNSVWYYDMNRRPGWRLPPKMKVARRKCAVAYVKPHLYVIGGLDNTGTINSVERFAIADYKWETLPHLLWKCHYMSVIVRNKMLIVYGCYHKPPAWEREMEKYTIQILDTESKTWYGAGFTEEHSPETKIKPAIMEHEGEYYRIIFNNASQSSAAQTQNGGDGDGGDKWKYSADHNDILVQKLIQELEDDKLIAKMGETIDQSCIPENQAGAFRIADDIFVNVNGFIHKTGVKVSSFADNKVDLGRWKNVNSISPKGKSLRRSEIRDSVTCLTYDTKIPLKEDWRM